MKTLTLVVLAPLLENAMVVILFVMILLDEKRLARPLSLHENDRVDQIRVLVTRYFVAYEASKVLEYTVSE